jgi:hypothetical protein
MNLVQLTKTAATSKILKLHRSKSFCVQDTTLPVVNRVMIAKLAMNKMIFSEVGNRIGRDAAHCMKRRLRGGNRVSRSTT